MTKIIIVHWRGGLSRWYPYSLETLEELASSCSGIDSIEILECGIEVQYTITKGDNNE
jgi:hypothetical protein